VRFTGFCSVVAGDEGLRTGRGCVVMGDLLKIGEFEFDGSYKCRSRPHYSEDWVDHADLYVGEGLPKITWRQYEWRKAAFAARYLGLDHVPVDGEVVKPGVWYDGKSGMFIEKTAGLAFA